MELCTCLQQHPWRTLKAIFRAYGLPFTPSPDKLSVCARLAAAILESERLQATWRALSPEAQAALRALAEADGLMRREVFTTRFGSIRPYRPWRGDAPKAPWKHPASPAEELAYRGLVFVLNQGSKRRPLWVVILPDEIKTALGPFLEVAVAVPSPPLTEPQKVPSADIGEAVLAFLCFLNREDIRPLHGRWLPPTACRTLAPHLPFQDQGWGRSEHQRSCLRNPQSEIRNQNPERVRSERQLPYLSFLHYLAERAGLVDLEGEWLKPTLAAQSWLAQSRAERLRTLWEVWREDDEANAELWSRFGLPGDSDLSPLTRFNRLLASLASLAPGDYPLDDLLEALIRHEPALLQPCAPYRIWAEMDERTKADFRQRARQWVAEMLTGPLAWFGATSHTQYPISNTQYPIPNPPSPLCFTPLGAALLERDDGVWPEDPPLAPLQLHPPILDDEGQPTAVPLTVPAGLPPASRFALAILTEGDDEQVSRFAPAGFEIQPPDRRIANPAGAEMIPDRRIADFHPEPFDCAQGRLCEGPAGAEVILSHRLTPRSLARALHRGHTVEGLVALLEELTRDLLHPAVLSALYTWAEAVEAITIAPALLLRVRDPALLQEISSIRRLRARLGETLSARAVTVEADQVEALLRHLERLGFYPRVEAATAPGAVTAPGGFAIRRARPGFAIQAEQVSAGERTAVAAALHLLVTLADELGLDLRAPHLLAQRWLEGLPQAQRDAARRQVETVLAALRRHDDRRGVEDYRLPSPTAPLLPELERAIAQGATIEIAYHTAGRGQLLTRRVDPLRLEWRGGVPYLVAFCHLRQETRVFRVDRIERVEGDNDITANRED